MQQKTMIPFWFQTGMSFTNKNIPGKHTIVQINESDNLCDVKIEQEGREPYVDEGWNLEHTIWGFERAEYLLLFKDPLDEMFNLIMDDVDPNEGWDF